MDVVFTNAEKIFIDADKWILDCDRDVLFYKDNELVSVFKMDDIVGVSDVGVIATPISNEKPIDQSTEEFVRVVRCKDCAYWGDMMNDAGYRYCYELEKNTYEDDYCSKGERRWG